MDIYLKKKPLLGSFSEVSAGPLKLMTEAHLDWLWKAPRLKDTGMKSPSINEIFLACEKVASIRPLWKLTSFLKFEQSVEILGRARDVWYLDELRSKHEHYALFLPMLAQLLFERYTTFTSRIVVMENREGEKRLAIAVKLVEHADLLFFSFEDGQMKALSSEGLRENPDYLTIRAVDAEDAVLKTGKIVNIVGYNRKMIPFTVTGRSPADKKYEQDERVYREANPQDPVPVEIYFHPYYRAFGHTTIRIGRTMYEMSSFGWRAHGLPVSSARAFLFNNPFFKSQLERFRSRHMAPFSVGKTILLPKEQAERIHIALENRCALKGRERKSFNILIANCNQEIMRVLESENLPGMKAGGYMGFSSVLTFRRFLFESDYVTEGYRLYPMAGFSGNLSAVRALFPKQLYRRNSITSEIARGWPIYFTDLLMGPVRWIAKKLKPKEPVAETKTLEGGEIYG